MILFKKATDLHNYLEDQRKMALSIGFVPTMGALHRGHISLINKSKEETKITVCSIFVNPTQFNDPEDFKKYPVTIESDIYQLESAGCDILFLPDMNEIYPDGTQGKGKYNLEFLETILEGKFRPGHFQGVCMVVDRLLEIVSLDKLYLGQKDYQQCMVIDKLIELTGKRSSVELRICPTQRESDGLAMSSRNTRLNSTERAKAVLISKVLEKIKTEISVDNIEVLKAKAIETLSESGFIVDYVEIADAKTLQPVETWDGKQKLVTLCAATIGNVRLIDNMHIN